MLGLAAVLLATTASVRADDIPIMATYELKKAREAARSASRDPKSFWIGQIVSRIAEKAPDASSPISGPATVQVTFVVARDGHVVSKSLIKSSGNKAADKMAITMLERAAPFPPMPASMSDAEMSFSVPIRFR